MGSTVIIDRLENAARYTGMNPLFGDAFAFLASPVLATLEPGVHQFDGFRVIAMAATGHGRQEAALEVHRREIDIHFTIEGDEVIGWSALSGLTMPRADFDEEKDYQLFDDDPQIWVSLPAGTFSIQFPGDGHAPLSGTGEVRKVVLKIADA